MPYAIDWAIVVLGSIGLITLATQTTRIAYRGSWEKPVHVLIMIHLAASVAAHIWAILAQNHDMFGIFPVEYSYFALLYFALFAWRSWTVRLKYGGASGHA